MTYDTTSLTDSDNANAQRVVTQDFAQLGNSSFGECEYAAWLDGAVKVDDDLFMQAAARSDDVRFDLKHGASCALARTNGASCALARTNSAPMTGPPMGNFRHASAYVVGVGGTTVVSNASDSSYAVEVAWNAAATG